MYRRVLVPTDGSDTAARAVLEAYEIARTFDATMHVLYVVDVDQKYPPGHLRRNRSAKHSVRRRASS